MRQDLKISNTDLIGISFGTSVSNIRTQYCTQLLTEIIYFRFVFQKRELSGVYGIARSVYGVEHSGDTYYLLINSSSIRQ